MSSARIHEHGAASVIRIDDVPRPVPGPGEVLIKVAATSFNPGTPPPWIPPVRRGGTIISAAAPVTAPPGVTSSHLVVQYDTTQLAELVRLVDAGVVTVDVTETYPLDAIAEVHRRSEAGEIRGKVTITPS